MKWWVYILLCGDGSFYTGIALDVGKRLEEHRRGRGARYTRGRGPLTLWWSGGPLSHGDALREERRIKGWTHARKERLGRDG